MNSQIIKSKFKCKHSTRVATSYPVNGIPTTWIDRFIEDKWYEGEYETWFSKDGERLYGGHRKYWVVNESGIKEEITRVYMNVIFYMNKDELRDQKIDECLH
jgi:hypothetical protein